MPAVQLQKPLTQAQFDRTSPARRRVIIAQDVLKSLKAKRFIAKGGFYISVGDTRGRHVPHQTFTGKELSQPDPLHRLLNKRALHCHVCAVGAACCSAVRLLNHTRYSETRTSTNSRLIAKSLDMWATVKQYFGESAHEMEHWFECNVVTKSEWPCLPERARMEAIYKNIVANRGDFKPIGNWWRKHLSKSVIKQAMSAA